MALNQKTASNKKMNVPSTSRANPGQPASSLDLDQGNKPLSEKIPESRGDLADQAENQIEATIQAEIDRARGR